MTVDNCKELHELVSLGRWEQAGNVILASLGQPTNCQGSQHGLRLAQGLFQHLLDSDLYLEAATLQWGAEMFNTEPESTVRVFRALGLDSRILLQGASSLSKTYAAGGYYLLDYLRDPYYTTVKLAAINEDHLKKNLFAHVVTLHRACAIPSPHKIIIQDSALWMGIKEAGNEFGISGLAFKQSQETSGQFKGYKAKPSRKKRHPKFGFMSRLRVLGDECVRGDQRISMGDGSLVTIKEIVEGRIAGSVLSLDVKTGEISPKAISGWHKVPLRGRRILNIGGAMVTEDHPVFTKNLRFELAANVKTCFSIGHEKLSCYGTPDERAALISSRGVNGRFFNISDSGEKGKCESNLYPWGGAIGLPKVEAGGFGELYDLANLRTTEDGVRGAGLQVPDPEPPGIHGDIPPSLQAGGKEIQSDDSSIHGRDGNGGLVHGRWEHSTDGRVQDPDNNDFHLLSSCRRRRCRNLPPWGHGGIGQRQTKQGEVRDRPECGRDEEVLGRCAAVYTPVLGLQVDRGSAAEQTRLHPGHDDSRNGQVQDMRKALSEASQGGDMRTGMQQETSSMAGEQEVQEDSFVYCIDVEDNHNFFAEGVCLHNCQNWPNGPFKDFNSLVASIAGTDLVKIACAYNPESMGQHVVQLAEPDEGWRIEDLDRLYDWVSKSGWRVCRLDAARCENVIQRRVVYPGLQTYEGYISYLQAGGDNSPNYLTFARGFPPVGGSVEVVIPPSWPQDARGEATFIETPVDCGAVDLAFMGKDSAQMAVGRWGLASGYRMENGKFVEFTDRLNVSVKKPRHVLQIDQIMPLAKHDNTVQMAEEIMGRCKAMGIKPEWLAVDKTGYGFGVHSHLMKVWGDAMGIAWNERATESKIIAEDMEGADKQCDGVMSEMWWALRKWLEPACRAVLINPIIPTQPIHTQLTTRRYKAGTTKGIKVEKKEEYMARNAQHSPDEADACVMLVHVVRRNAKVLPGLVESQDSAKSVNDRTGIKFLSVRQMVNVDFPDSICGDGEGEQ